MKPRRGIQQFLFGIIGAVICTTAAETQFPAENVRRRLGSKAKEWNRLHQHPPFCRILRVEFNSDDENDTVENIQCFCHENKVDQRFLREYKGEACLRIAKDSSFVNDQTKMMVLSEDEQKLLQIFRFHSSLPLSESSITNNENGNRHGSDWDASTLENSANFLKQSNFLSKRRNYGRRRLEDGVTNVPTEPVPTVPAPTPTAPPVPAPTLPPTVPVPVTPAPVALPPTAAPVPPPTTPPTNAPTTAPPTRTPTAAPVTSSPTLTPTQQPSSAPTVVASAPPTVTESEVPSATPTGKPSVSSTPAPTVEPTFNPTRSPNNEPTLSPYPSAEPTPKPVKQPTEPPTDGPTNMPSVAPSFLPSASPSASPSLPEQLFDLNVVIEMRLPSLLPRKSVEGPATTFELQVAKTVKASITDEANDYGAPLIGLEVFANFIDQDYIETLEPAAPASRRNLQQLQGVWVEFVVRVVFKSVDPREKVDIEDMVGDAFNNELKRQTFAAQLGIQDDFFEGVIVDRVVVEGEEPPEDNLDNDDSGSTRLIVIAAAAGGGFIALLALGFLAFRRSSNSNSVGTPMEHDEIEEEQSRSQANTEAKFGVSAEILVERQDDISTLGDPVFGMGMGGMMTGNAERDEQTASVGNDYDYTKQYLRAQGLASMEGGSREFSRDRLGSTGSFDQTRTNSSNSGAFKLSGGLVTPSVFSDDASFDQRVGDGGIQHRFEVRVPPGKLGMVIDTPNGGIPAVRAIKPESVLADKVKVGDRLVAVDGDDVTAMTTVQVSKLISLKSDQQRVLAFMTSRDIRGRGRDASD